MRERLQIKGKHALQELNRSEEQQHLHTHNADDAGGEVQRGEVPVAVTSPPLTALRGVRSSRSF